jgi:hypothetical protein
MLTPIERRILTNYQKFRAQGGPGLLALLGWRSVCYPVGAALIGVGLYLGASPWWAIFIGLAAGAFWVNLTRARQIILAWPTIARVLDWQRVEALLTMNERIRTKLDR